MKIYSGFLFAALLLFTSSGWARVFNFSGEKFAPYIKGSYQPTTVGDQAFATSSGTGNTFSSKNTYNTSFEFGFAYGFKGMRLRFGFEALKPPTLSGVTGADAGGTSMYALNSDILGYAPKIGFELNLKEWPTSRLYVSGDYGAMSVTVKNTYAFTADGTAAYPGMVDFTEELKGSGQAIDGAVGFEFLAFDTTTFSIEVGYRTMTIANLKHNLPVTSFQGAVVKGDAALNDDGTARALALSNLYASLGFRFWIF